MISSTYITRKCILPITSLGSPPRARIATSREAIYDVRHDILMSSKSDYYCRSVDDVVRDILSFHRGWIIQLYCMAALDRYMEHPAYTTHHLDPDF